MHADLFWASPSLQRGSGALRGTLQHKGARVRSGHGCAGGQRENKQFWVKTLRKMAALPNPPSMYLQ